MFPRTKSIDHKLPTAIISYFQCSFMKLHPPLLPLQSLGYLLSVSFSLLSSIICKRKHGAKLHFLLYFSSLSSLNWRRSTHFHHHFAARIPPEWTIPCKYSSLWWPCCACVNSLAISVTITFHYYYFSLTFFQGERSIGGDGCSAEVCLFRRFMVDHTDYIYTQNINGPWLHAWFSPFKWPTVSTFLVSSHCMTCSYPRWKSIVSMLYRIYLGYHEGYMNLLDLALAHWLNWSRLAFIAWFRNFFCFSSE